MIKTLFSNTLITFTIISLSSCSYSKSTDDHKMFVEEKLEKMFNQKNIFQPSSILDIDYRNYEQRKFIDFIETKRTKNGNCVSTMMLYETYYNNIPCRLPSYQTFNLQQGWHSSETNGSKLISILKRPLGRIVIRTDYDGEDIYIINIENFQNEEDENKKNKWNTLFKLDFPCQ